MNNLFQEKYFFSTSNYELEFVDKNLFAL